MPAKTKKQRAAAGAELGRREKGKRGGKGKPFGTAPTKTVKKFARKSKR